LFVVPYTPTRVRTRPYHLIRALSGVGHRVAVATLWSGAEDQVALRQLASVGITVTAERLPASRSLWNCLRALPGAEPLQAHYSWSPRLARRLAQLVEDTSFDVVHVEHLRGVRYGLALARAAARTGTRRPAMVWDSVDCISSLFRRAAQQSLTRRVRMAAKLELPRTERFEGSVASRFDRVLVTSEIDRHELLQLTDGGTCGLPAARVEVLPNGVDLDYFSPSTEPRDPATLVITGKMSYHANATAVIRFVEDVMPTIWAELPETQLWVVGKDPTRELIKLGRAGVDTGSNGSGPDPSARVRVTGTVEDLRPSLRRATLAVAPIQYGVGIQNKVLEALACATPVVATRQAVSALEAEHGHDLVVASSPGELAQAIVAMLRDPGRRERIGRAGRAFVERRHNWRGLASRLTEIYHDARP
jgi:glycosyltransferase involved in cell wall biosynthesis